MEDYETISGNTGRKRLLIEHGSDIHVCRVSEICCIHTEHGYTKVLLSDGSWGVTEKSLTALETELNPDEFFRVNRQTIVNIDRIRKISLTDERDSAVSLTVPWADLSFVITAERKKELLRILDC